MLKGDLMYLIRVCCICS